MRHEPECIAPLVRAGIERQDAYAIRRVAMTLHRWHELECGTDSYCIVRGKWNNATAQFDYADDGLPHYEFDGLSGRSRYSRIPDRETPALKRIAKIVAKYPGLSFYVQGDPRGASLYIIRPGDVREGARVDSCYSNGVAVYK